MFALCILLITPLSVYADILQRPLSPWSCPPTSGSGAPPPTINKDDGEEPPAHVGKLDRLYIHIIDERGNDFQVWCLDHGDTGDYAYYRSELGKTDRRIGGCLLFCGVNDGSMTVSDGAKILPNGTNVNGTKMYLINGTLIAYNHTNWVDPGHPTSGDRGKDHHFFYNWTSSEWQHDRTRIDPTTGRHIIINSTRIIFDPQDNSGSPEVIKKPQQETSKGIVGEESKMPTEFGIENYYLYVSEQDGGPATFRIAYPTQVKIENMIFSSEEKSLTMSLPDTEHENYLNISIPRQLIDHDESSFLVLVDGEQSEFTEETTFSHRTLTIEVDPYAKEVTIIGTTAIPEFGIFGMVVLIISMILMYAFSLTRFNFKI